MQSQLWGSVLPIVDLLESLDVEFHIGGSLASSFAGIARSTQDVDLVADLRLVHSFLLPRALEKSYFIANERVDQAIQTRSSFNVIHLETMFKVDLFVMPDSPFDRSVMRRRVSLDIPEIERSLPFCSPEDIVLHKLRWYEMGNRVADRQWYDIQGVLKLQGDGLDLGYLRRWALELGLAPLLDEALSDAGVPG